MMTKDEALRGLTIGDCRTRREAFKTVRELLNREECEDAISRTEVIKSIDEREDVNGKVDAESVRTDIALMPPVKPQEPSYNSINPELNGDMISRQAVLDVVFESRKNFNNEFDQGFFADKIRDLSPVNPQPKTGHCKDCKYFEYDNVAKVDGIPLIVAHEICKRWGDGCKTKEDGYCFMFEPQESEG